MKISHIINPVLVDETSDLFIAQPITFETMRIAKKFTEGKVDVTLLAVNSRNEDIKFLEGFKKVKTLKKSVCDVSNFKHKRNLPILSDILERLYNYDNEADYLIYTNVDIALQPYFYQAVSSIISQGYDAFAINRRTISKEYSTIDEIPLMYMEIGTKHAGYDCFVFKKELYPSLEFGNTCIGTGWIGRIFIANLIKHSSKFKVFEDQHLTFHIGNDRQWANSEFDEYLKHNENEFKKKFTELESIIRYGHNEYIKTILQQPITLKKSNFSNLLNKTGKLFKEKLFQKN